MRTKRNIHDLILEARKKTALSQSQFARLLGCHERTVLRYENGHQKVSKSYFEKCKNLLTTPLPELESLLQAFHQPQVYFDKKNDLILKLHRAS